MNVLVIGANGQLGSAFRALGEECTDRYIFADVSDASGADTIRLDACDIDAVRTAVGQIGADIIVNCAAYTDVDRAEVDEARCELLNVRIPENLATVMKETGGLLVHFSTDYVFGGIAAVTPCVEDSPAAPLGVYGMTKYRGERVIQESGCHHLIIRTAWLYGGKGKNFLKTILALASSRPELKVVNDQRGTPTYAMDLAGAVCDIINGRKYVGNDGVYHYSGEGDCTWYDFASKIVEYAGLEGCVVRPCTSEEYPSTVRRPSYSVLDKTRIRSTFGIDIPYWTDSLKKCLSNI